MKQQYKQRASTCGGTAVGCDWLLLHHWGFHSLLAAAAAVFPQSSGPEAAPVAGSSGTGG